MIFPFARTEKIRVGNKKFNQTMNKLLIILIYIKFQKENSLFMRADENFFIALIIIIVKKPYFSFHIMFLILKSVFLHKAIRFVYSKVFFFVILINFKIETGMFSKKKIEIKSNTY